MNYVMPKEANYRARLFICGGKMHEKTHRIEPIAGQWHPRFRDHPWVQLSTEEGWDVELRGHLALVISNRIMQNADYSRIESLMPDEKWVKAAQDRAAVNRNAKEWRDKVTASHGSVEGYLKAMRNVPIYSDFKPLSTQPKPKDRSKLSDLIDGSLKRIVPDDSDMTLTERSRRMMGDDA